MRIISSLLIICVAGSSLAIFNSNGDLDNNAGVNFQVLYSQKQYELTNLNKECNSRYNDFKAEILEYKNNITKINAALKDASNTNAQMTSDLNGCKKTVLQIDTLNVQIDKLNVNIGDLSKQNKQMDSDLQKVTGQYNDKCKEYDALNLTYKQTTQKVDSLTAIIGTNQTSMQDYKLQISQLNATIVKLNVSKDNEAKYKVIILDLQSQLDKVNKNLSDLNDKYTAQTDVVTQLKAEVETKKTLEANMKDLNGQLTDAKAQNDKYNLSISDLNIKIKSISIDIEKKVGDYNDKLAALQAKYDKCGKDSDDLKSANATSVAAVADLTLKLKAIDALKATIADYKAQIDQAGTDKKSYLEQITKLNSSVDSYKNLESDNKVLAIKIDTLNLKITDMTKANADCDKKSKNFEAISKKLYSDLQAMTDKIDVSASNTKGATILIGQSLNADY